MPEYLAPGVYVTEVATGAKPIEGVSTSTAGMVGSDTVALLQQMAQPTPDWTDFNENDPGIALIELFAFITESLLYRNGRLSERGRSHAARLAAAALTLTGTCEQPEGSVLRKVRFFHGRMLDEDDLRTEQENARPR